MNQENILIEAFDYPLPEEKIARYPLKERDESRLLIYRSGNLDEDQYNNISAHIPPGSFLVFNNTKVVEARLLFEKQTGSIIEIFCLEPAEIYADITTAMTQKNKVHWKCLVGGAKKWKEEKLQKIIQYGDKEIILTAIKEAKRSDHFIIYFEWNGEASFAEILHAAGAIPLPPYLNRSAEKEDTERYQTIYALHDGSVAAPTAGLHFTQEVFESLKAKNIQSDYVTLHVGAGTFKPVQSDSIKDHEMHAEFIDVNISFIENLLSTLSNNIIAVGTTSLRTIESLYWIGNIIHRNPDSSINDLYVTQWMPYEKKEKISAEMALKNIIDWMKKNNTQQLVTKTQIMIVPGYEFKIINGLITNFHQPKSTLLLLVAALIGESWKKVYNYALENNFRFLSYGDGCLLWNAG
ncbi:MAG: S-adenosylmethionine:tRNA ribosyltransferase-isomerase [Chitinophagaceae bacterium]|nr:S-adenosylmethionine:tRNA ribosyltransferase-isomerase [Chitinophagaceae bacterium]